MRQSCMKKSFSRQRKYMFLNQKQIFRRERRKWWVLGEKKKLRSMGFKASEALGSCSLASRGVQGLWPGHASFVTATGWWRVRCTEVAGAGARGRKGGWGCSNTMLQEHQVLTCSQGQSECECKVKAKEETDAQITSNKRDVRFESVSLAPNREAWLWDS